MKYVSKREKVAKLGKTCLVVINFMDDVGLLMSFFHI